MKARNGIALGVAAFVIGLIAFAPARLLESAVNRALAPQAQVVISGGTVWSGRGVLSMSSPATLVPFAWRFDPLALLRLRLGVAVSADSAALSGDSRIALGLRSIEVRDARLRMDAGLAGNLNSLVGLFGPGGTLQLSTAPGEALTSSYRGVPLAEGTLNVRADNAMLRSVSPRAFGSYNLKIVLRDAGAEYQFIDATGPLKLDGGGSVKWSTPRQFTYRGIASAPREMPETLAPLRAIGRPMADGRLQIEYQAGW